MRWGIVVLLGSIAVAHADARPRLEEFTSSTPAWAKDCTVDVVSLGENAFSVAVACRGSEDLMFERRAKRPGPLSGTITSFDGATRVLVWRTGKYATDVYSCSSTAELDPAARCKTLVDAVEKSTFVRRGAGAFGRPKS